MLGIGPWERMSRLVPEAYRDLLEQQLDMAVLAMVSAGMSSDMTGQIALVEVGGAEAPPARFRRYLGERGLVWDAYGKFWTGVVTLEEEHAIRVQADVLSTQTGWQGAARIVAPAHYSVRFGRAEAGHDPA